MQKIFTLFTVLTVWLCTALPGQAQVPGFTVSDLPLGEALQAWQTKTGTALYYNEAVLPKNHRVSGDFSQKTPEEALRMILKGTDLEFVKQGSGYIVRSKNRTDAGEAPPAAPKSGRATFSGYIREKSSGENLIGASVYLPGTTTGTVSNTYGYFSLALPEADSVTVAVSFTGYKTQEFRVPGRTGLQTEIQLENSATLGAVSIEASKAEKVSEGTGMSSITLTQEEIEKVPTLMGETDLLRVIQLMPGVQSGGEGGTGFYVRGGGPDQNLILLDGVPVYNASHLFGFFSVFNTDAISRVELIKGGFPARYGGRLSSVLDIQMKEGNMKKYTGEGSVGPLAIKLTGEGPIVKNKASFLISARRTFIDLFLLPYNAANKSGQGFSYYFYDVNAKLNWKLNDKHRLYLSAYAGGDELSLKFNNKDDAGNSTKQKVKLGWGNMTGSLRWNYLISKNLFMNTTLTYTRYRFHTGAGFLSESDNYTLDYGYKYNTGIDDLGAGVDFDWYAGNKHHVKFGGRYVYHYFTLGNITQRVNDSSSTYRSGNLGASEATLYMEDEWKIHPKFTVNLGVHGSAFWVPNDFYWSIQPRVSVAYKIIPNLAVKASYSEMTQYIQLLSNPGLNLPTDIWLPSTQNIKPQRSRQMALGLFKDWGNILETTVEGYYKTMTNVLDYRNGTSFLLAGSDWENRLVQGKGESYGMEVLVRRKTGKLTGWVGYTLSWTNRQFAELNGGKPFPYRYDRRHDFEITLSYAVTKNIDISATWVYGTGNAVTMPTESYPLAGMPFTGFESLQNFDERNGFRMRANHRLDLSVNFNKTTKWGKRTWNISIYNVYSRQNPFFYYVNQNKLMQVSILPIIPSFSYIFKFK